MYHSVVTITGKAMHVWHMGYMENHYTFPKLTVNFILNKVNKNISNINEINNVHWSKVGHNYEFGF